MQDLTHFRVFGPLICPKPSRWCWQLSLLQYIVLYSSSGLTMKHSYLLNASNNATIYLEYHKSSFLSTWIESNMINMNILLPALTTCMNITTSRGNGNKSSIFLLLITQVNSQQLYVLFKPPIQFKDKEITTPFSDHKNIMGELFVLLWPISISQKTIPRLACCKKYVTL